LLTKLSEDLDLGRFTPPDCDRGSLGYRPILQYSRVNFIW